MTAQTRTARARGAVHDLSSLLDLVESSVARDHGSGSLSVGDLLELVGRRTYGPLLLLIGLISVSPATMIPGATWAFAALTFLVALQLALHKTRPWLPRRALAMRLPEDKLKGFVVRARPAARVVDRIIRPRLQFLAEPPWLIGVALLCMLAALITFPLGLIPLAPVLPGLSIVLFGLGVTARDGLLLTFGGLASAAAAWLLLSRLV